METRTSLWELENGNYETDYYNFVPVESSILTKFQNDLNLLRCLTINIPVSREGWISINNFTDERLFVDRAIKNLSLRSRAALDVRSSSDQNSIPARPKPSPAKQQAVNNLWIKGSSSVRR